MSNFICENCDTECIDTIIGYITGCEHYPANVGGLPDDMEKVLHENAWKLYVHADAKVSNV